MVEAIPQVPPGQMDEQRGRSNTFGLRKQHHQLSSSTWATRKTFVSQRLDESFDKDRHSLASNPQREDEELLAFFSEEGLDLPNLIIPSG